MLRSLLVLPDGTRLFSGETGKPAIQSMTLTECVNDTTELSVGSACANAVEVSIIAPEGALMLSAGEEVAVYKVDSGGLEHKVGLFTLEKPTRPSANALKLTAYDRVSWLDKDLGQWLYELDGWPYRLYDFAKMVCEACGLTLINEELPNGDYQIQAFSGEGITGRQLMQWIGQAAGRFCRATADGQIEFAWYKRVDTHLIGAGADVCGRISRESDGSTVFLGENIASEEDGEGNVTMESDTICVQEDGEGNISVTVTEDRQIIPFYQNSLSYEDYQVAKVEKVQLRLTDEDVGAVYPDTIEESNTYSITGNYLLTNADAEALEPLAQTLYEQLKDITYTPCKVSIPADLDIHAGDIVDITDRNGRTITAYVMAKTQAGQRDTLECTGSPRRDSSTAMNTQSYKALSGKVLNLRMDVEGLKLENADAAGKLASLTLDVEGIQTQVSQQSADTEDLRQQLTTVSQNAESVHIQVQEILNDGVSKVKSGKGYTFDDEGLKISREGGEMENTLDDTGMYVKRGDDIMLQANNNGVIATDVTVRNYLHIGSHARLEDYSNGTDRQRTACFWVQEVTA